MAGRVKKSILNAEVNLTFYFITLFLSFFSRKTFLDNLGAEFIGLTGTLGNILGYLNIAELGIGNCISFFLYKPLQTKNQQEITEITSVLGYLYRCIGLIILTSGIVVSLFFPWIFSGEALGLSIVYFAFFSFLTSSLVGYFINYRQIILSADQKGYLIAIYMQSATILKTALQIFLALYYQNLYLWIAVEFIFSLISCIIINWKINKEYPWLQIRVSQGKKLLKKYPGIIKNTKQIFIHKMKDTILFKSDELLIFAFVSMKMVAYYGNYTIIVAKIGMLFSTVLDSISAGVGNLIAEGNQNSIMKVFWELMTIRHFVAGVLCFSIYHFIEPFISIWLGEQYILANEILLLLCIYIYITTSRGVVDMYNHSHGLYGDIWAAWTELVINVSVSLVAGFYLGIVGILLGKIVSTGLIIILWKPYYLFRTGLHRSYTEYWRGASRNFIVSLVSIGMAHICLQHVSIKADEGYLPWILYCITGLTVYLIINLTLTFLFCKGAKDSLNRITTRFIHHPIHE